MDFTPSLHSPARQRRLVCLNVSSHKSRAVTLSKKDLLKIPFDIFIRGHNSCSYHIDDANAKFVSVK